MIILKHIQVLELLFVNFKDVINHSSVNTIFNNIKRDIKLNNQNNSFQLMSNNPLRQILITKMIRTKTRIL